jgi:PAS domain S-box-containing protein
METQPAALQPDDGLSADLEATLRRRRFVQFCWFCLAALGLRAVISLVNGSPFTAGLLLTNMVVIVVCVWLHRRGLQEIACALLLFSLTVMITLLAWSGEGLYDIALVAYPIILVMGAMLLPRRLFWALVGFMACAMALLAWAYLTSGRSLRMDPLPTRISDWAVIMVVGMLTIWLIKSDFERILAQLRLQVQRAQSAADLLQVSEHKTRVMFNGSPVPMAVFDASPLLGPPRSNPGLRVVSINDAWTSELRYTREQALGRTGRELGFWSDLAEQGRFAEALRRDGHVQGFETRFVRADGSQFLGHVNASTTRVGDALLLVASCEDVTAQRANEREIQLLNTELEARVALRTEDLLRVNQDLEQTLANLRATQQNLVQAEKMAALGRLVAGIAHELNTPIGNSLMAVTTVRAQLRDFRTDVRTSGLRRAAFETFLANVDMAGDIAQRNLERSAELVASFKQLAADRANATRRQFRLQDLVNNTLIALSAGVKRMPYTFRVNIPGDLILDSFPGALELVLTNLVSNAIVHGFDGRDHGLVDISAQVTSGGRVVIIVADDGKGIEAEHQPRIFDPFFTTRLGQGSSGLGLNVAHNAVSEILGGTIHVRSEPGEGCKFVIDIPVVAPMLEGVPVL